MSNKIDDRSFEKTNEKANNIGRVEMSICMLLTIAVVVCTLVGCAFLLCCIRVSSERENRRQNIACSVETESNTSSITPMLPPKVENIARCNGDVV